MPLFWGQKTCLKGGTGPIGPAGPIAPLTLVLPTPAGTERRPLLLAPHQLTISKISAVLVGGTAPTATFTVRHGSDAAATGALVTTASIVCNSTTSGTVISTFDNPVVAAGSWLWVLLSARTGTPTGLTIQIDFA